MPKIDGPCGHPRVALGAAALDRSRPADFWGIFPMGKKSDRECIENL